MNFIRIYRNHGATESDVAAAGMMECLHTALNQANGEFLMCVLFIAEFIKMGFKDREASQLLWFPKQRLITWR